MPDCFACGLPMPLIAGCLYTWRCPSCEVTEYCPPERFVSRVRTISATTWLGEDIVYINHATEHYPSPA